MGTLLARSAFLLLSYARTPANRFPGGDYHTHRPGAARRPLLSTGPVSPNPTWKGKGGWSRTAAVGSPVRQMVYKPRKCGKRESVCEDYPTNGRGEGKGRKGRNRKEARIPINRKRETDQPQPYEPQTRPPTRGIMDEPSTQPDHRAQQKGEHVRGLPDQWEGGRKGKEGEE